MAGDALVPLHGIRRQAGVAGEAFGVGGGRLLSMPDAKALVVGRWAYVAVVACGESCFNAVAVAQSAIRHLELRA